MSRADILFFLCYDDCMKKIRKYVILASVIYFILVSIAFYCADSTREVAIVTSVYLAIGTVGIVPVVIILSYRDRN